MTSTKTQVTMFEILHVGRKLNYFLNISIYSHRIITESQGTEKYPTCNKETEG